MAAIFRVKRRNEDEPLDSLLVACKRRKTGHDETDTETDSLSKVVKFVGTVKNPDENVMEHITKKISKEELKSNFKQHIVDITDKVRKETKEKSSQNRFKIVNQFRSLDSSNTEDIDAEEVTVFDVEDTASCAVEQKDSDDKENYVYDLYYTTNESENYLVDHIQINKLVYDTYREHGVFDSDHNDSEDSNSESHWKNDYPDSDHSENSILEDDMRYAVGKIKIHGEDSDLSSDDEDFAYGVDSEDVNNFGLRYAKFKARVMGKDDDDNDDDDDDDDDYDKSKDDDESNSDCDENYDHFN